MIGYMAFTQNGLYSTFSWIWTGVLTALVYLLVRYTWKSAKAETPALRRREAYGFCLALIEVLSVGALVFSAVMFSNVATTPGNGQLLTLILFTGGLAICTVVGARVVRMVTDRQFAYTN